MFKGYCIASLQGFNGIGKPPGKAQIPAITQQERRQNHPAAIGINVAISFNFL
jgi:hypothetical protein